MAYPPNRGSRKHLKLPARLVSGNGENQCKGNSQHSLVRIHIITPPAREWDRAASGSHDSECHDEYRNLSTSWRIWQTKLAHDYAKYHDSWCILTIKRSADYELVFSEPSGTVLADIPLEEQSENQLLRCKVACQLSIWNYMTGRLYNTYSHGDGRVNANTEISEEPGYNGSVDDIESNLGELLVKEVEWQWKKESDQKGPCNRIVDLSRTEELGSQTTPRYGTRVECLGVLTTPNVGTLRTEKNVTLILDNGKHNNIVQQAAHNSTDNLSSEDSPRWNLEVLAHFKIRNHVNSLSNSVVAIQSEPPEGMKVSAPNVVRWHLTVMKLTCWQRVVWEECIHR